MLKIGDITMKNPVVLAPMAGVCNSAFRLTVKEFGAGLVCAEMVSDKGIVNKNEKTLNMLYMDEREKPLLYKLLNLLKKIQTQILLISIWAALCRKLQKWMQVLSGFLTRIKFMKWYRQLWMLLTNQ